MATDASLNPSSTIPAGPTNSSDEEGTALDKTVLSVPSEALTVALDETDPESLSGRKLSASWNVFKKMDQAEVTNPRAEASRSRNSSPRFDDLLQPQSQTESNAWAALTDASAAVLKLRYELLALKQKDKESNLADYWQKYDPLQCGSLTIDRWRYFIEDLGIASISEVQAQLFEQFCRPGEDSVSVQHLMQEMEQEQEKCLALMQDVLKKHLERYGPLVLAGETPHTAGNSPHDTHSKSRNCLEWPHFRGADSPISNPQFGNLANCSNEPSPLA